MEYLIYFAVFFIILYVLYYVLYVRKRVIYDPNNVSADIKIFTGYYKINVEKIGYQKVLHILNFVNALIMSLMMLIVVKIDKVAYKFLILLILMIPCIWVTYYFLAKYLRYLEGKSEENDL